MISIIIRTRNEERWIGHCLWAISNQDLQQFEVIVVDNGSTDKTLEVIEEARKNLPRLKIVRFDGQFKPGAAINLGISNSIGKLIVVLSGHCIPTSNGWLTSLSKKLKNENVGGVYGRQEPLPFSSPLDKRDLAITFGLDPKIQIKDPFFHNANSAFRREIWNMFPFDEEVSNIEDRVWGARLIENNYEIHYIPEASVYHFHGIHHNADRQRAQQIVTIMERLENTDTKIVTSLNDRFGKGQVVGIVPIRGECLSVDGKYLLAEIAEHLSNCELLGQTFVSTDTEYTLKVAQELGFKVLGLRPVELSGGFTSVDDVLKFELDRIEKSLGHVDLVFALEETHRYRDDGLIQSLISKLIQENLDTVMSGKYLYRPLWKVEDGSLVPLGNQDNAPREFKKNAFVYGVFGAGIVTRSHLVRAGSVVGEKLGLYPVKHPLCDTEVRLASTADLITKEDISA